MANYATLKAAIQQVVKTNGNNEITGALLQQSLLAMVTSLGADYMFVGVASPSTNPGTPDQNVFYIAGPGTYPNFNNSVVNDGELGVMKYNGSWTFETVPVGKSDDQEIYRILAVNKSVIDNLNYKPFGLYAIGVPPGFSYTEQLYLYTCCCRNNNGVYQQSVSIRNADNEIYSSILVDITNETGLLSVTHGTTGFVFIIDVMQAKANAISSYQSYGTTLPINRNALKTTLLSQILASRVNFTGTDGSVAGTAGYVPAPQTGDKDSMLFGDGTWKKGNAVDYFAQLTKTVSSNSQRATNFDVSPGQKIRVRVTATDNGGNQFSVYWTSVASGNLIATKPVGAITDELVVPSGVTRMVVFPTQINHTYYFQLYNSEASKWYVDELRSANAYERAKQQQVLEFSTDVVVSSSVQYVLTTDDGIRNGLAGNIMVTYNGGTAEFVRVRFYATDGSIFDITKREFNQVRTRIVFRNKTLGHIAFLADEITSAGNVKLTVYSLQDSQLFPDYPLMDKKIICFGDSITEFKTTFDNMRYSDHLANLSGAIVINSGVGGTRLAQRETPSLTPTGNQQCVAAFEIVSLVTAWAAADYSLQNAALASGYLTEAQQSVCQRVLNSLIANPIANFDIVTILGGTNDYTGGTVIGEATQGNTNKGTLYGAVNSMISAILAAKPRMQIYAFSPLIRMFQQTISIETSSDVYIPADAPGGKSLPEFCETIHDAFKKNHIPFTDLYWSLGWNVYNFTEFFGTDYTHPYQGFNVIGEKILKTLLNK